MDSSSEWLLLPVWGTLGWLLLTYITFQSVFEQHTVFEKSSQYSTLLWFHFKGHFVGFHLAFISCVTLIYFSLSEVPWWLEICLTFYTFAYFQEHKYWINQVCLLQIQTCQIMSYPFSPFYPLPRGHHCCQHVAWRFCCCFSMHLHSEIHAKGNEQFVGCFLFQTMWYHIVRVVPHFSPLKILSYRSV